MTYRFWFCTVCKCVGAKEPAVCACDSAADVEVEPACRDCGAPDACACDRGDESAPAEQLEMGEISVR